MIFGVSTGRKPAAADKGLPAALAFAHDALDPLPLTAFRTGLAGGLGGLAKRSGFAVLIGDNHLTVRIIAAAPKITVLVLAPDQRILTAGTVNLHLGAEPLKRGRLLLLLFHLSR